MNLEVIFKELVQYYTNNHLLINELWDNINSNYSQKNRHYHNLDHLENLYKKLYPYRDKFKNWNIVLLSIFYHDIIYNTLKSDNEEKSAQAALKSLTTIQIPQSEIDICVEMILATKKHSVSNNLDINYFTDADLSILGANWEEYEQYFKNVRKEYWFYPSFLYHPGRKKILQHFLSMERIFKTEEFFDLYEYPARTNIQREIDLL